MMRAPPQGRARRKGALRNAGVMACIAIVLVAAGFVVATRSSSIAAVGGWGGVREAGAAEAEDGGVAGVSRGDVADPVAPALVLWAEAPPAHLVAFPVNASREFVARESVEEWAEVGRLREEAELRARALGAAAAAAGSARASGAWGSIREITRGGPGLGAGSGNEASPDPPGFLRTKTGSPIFVPDAFSPDQSREHPRDLTLPPFPPASRPGTLVIYVYHAQAGPERREHRDRFKTFLRLGTSRGDGVRYLVVVPPRQGRAVRAELAAALAADEGGWGGEFSSWPEEEAVDLGRWEIEGAGEDDVADGRDLAHGHGWEGRAEGEARPGEGEGEGAGSEAALGPPAAAARVGGRSLRPDPARPFFPPTRPTPPHIRVRELSAACNSTWGLVGEAIRTLRTEVEDASSLVVVDSRVTGPFVPPYARRLVHWTDAFTVPLADAGGAATSGSRAARGERSLLGGWALTGSGGAAPASPQAWVSTRDPTSSKSDEGEDRAGGPPSSSAADPAAGSPRPVALVSTFASCGGAFEAGDAGKHHRRQPGISRHAWATNARGLAAMLAAGDVLTCPLDLYDERYRGDVGAPLAVLEAGLGVDTLLARYRGVDWRDEASWHCNAGARPDGMGTMDGGTLDPFDVMFSPFTKGQAESYNSLRVLTKYHSWAEPGLDMDINEYLGSRTFIKPPILELEWSQRGENALLWLAIKGGSACFDGEGYLAAYPDVAAQLARSPAVAFSPFEHYLLAGSHQARVANWTCLPPEFPRAALVRRAALRGRACFDVDGYRRERPGLDARSATSDAAAFEHYVRVGQFDGKPVPWLCSETTGALARARDGASAAELDTERDALLASLGAGDVGTLMPSVSTFAELGRLAAKGLGSPSAIGSGSSASAAAAAAVAAAARSPGSAGAGAPRLAGSPPPPGSGPATAAVAREADLLGNPGVLTGATAGAANASEVAGARPDPNASDASATARRAGAAGRWGADPLDVWKNDAESGGEGAREAAERLVEISGRDDLLQQASAGGDGGADGLDGASAPAPGPAGERSQRSPAGRSRTLAEQLPVTSAAAEQPPRDPRSGSAPGAAPAGPADASAADAPPVDASATPAAPAAPAASATPAVEATPETGADPAAPADPSHLPGAASSEPALDSTEATEATV